MALDGRTRRDGQPRLQHSAATAGILADMGLDEETVAAGLLHEVSAPLSPQVRAHAPTSMPGGELASGLHALVQLTVPFASWARPCHVCLFP